MIRLTPTRGNVRQDPYRGYRGYARQTLINRSRTAATAVETELALRSMQDEKLHGVTPPVLELASPLVSDTKCPQVSDSAESTRRSPAWCIGCLVRNLHLRIPANGKFCNGQCSGGSHTADAATVVEGDSNVRRQTAWMMMSTNHYDCHIKKGASRVPLAPPVKRAYYCFCATTSRIIAARSLGIA